MLQDLRGRGGNGLHQERQRACEPWRELVEVEDSRRGVPWLVTLRQVARLFALTSCSLYMNCENDGRCTNEPDLDSLSQVCAPPGQVNHLRPSVHEMGWTVHGSSRQLQGHRLGDSGRFSRRVWPMSAYIRNSMKGIVCEVGWTACMPALCHLVEERQSRLQVLPSPLLMLRAPPHVAMLPQDR